MEVLDYIKYGLKEFPLVCYVNLYSTYRCNSKCKICGFWKMKNGKELSAKIIEKNLLTSSFFNKETCFVLQGGEITLHSQFENIIKLFNSSGVNYTLFSNGILTDKLTTIVKKYNIKSVSVSLDAVGKRYKNSRGVDAFNNVLTTIKRLKEITDLYIGFTFSQWNNEHDYLQVKELCDALEINLGENICSESRIYDSNEKMISAFSGDLCSNNFIKAYDKWKSNNLKIPCYSIRLVVSITPNGDVYLCHNKDIVLGNINNSTFDEIWSSDTTNILHNKYLHCNDCWTSCYREYDYDIFYNKLS